MRTVLVSLLLASLSCSSCKNKFGGSHGEPTRTAFSGKLGDRPFRLLLERDGSSLTGLYQRGEGVPVRLAGEADAPKVKLAEPGAKGEKVLEIEGEQKPDGSFAGTLHGRDGAAQPLAATANAPFAGVPDPDRWYAGTIGDQDVRAHLAKKGGALSGQLLWQRDVAADEALDGTVDPQSGAVALSAKKASAPSGSFKGLALSPTILVGTWTSADGKQSQPVLLQGAQSPPPVVQLGGGLRIVPQGRFARTAPNCLVDLLWPAVVGVEPAEVKKRLETEMKDHATAGVDAVPKCSAPEEGPQYLQSSAYAVGAFSQRAVALELTRTEYQGGAHANSTADCVVADLKEGILLEPSKMIAKKPELAGLVTRALQQKTGSKDLTKIGFSAQPVPLDNAQICLRAGHVLVQYNALAVGPNSLGTPAVELTAKEVAPLLMHNQAMDSLLR